ncbi:MAG TPA: sugar phosphate nucleotidyltransferase [Myxococcota bacterium]|nr:sugar phosphate nucleotidyltransferase [Myxococcota bacterium]
MHGNPWSIILAGGEGRRLRELTTTRAGVTVPKQFCSLNGGPSLLANTLQRAESVSKRERTVVVVSSRHERFWRDELRWLPSENVIVQPQARGTGPGLLLPLLSVLERDPAAEVLVLPSDHHVDDERTLHGAFESAFDAVRDDPRQIVLLGVTPDAPDTQYGWIVPADGAALARGASGIELFVEKPDRETARSLLARGALWSSFLFASHGLGLLAAFSRAQSALVRAFAERPLEAVYRKIPSVDFSREVLERVADRLGVVRVPPCGWSDLGTPDRIASVLGGRCARRPFGAPQLRSRVPILAHALESLAH